MNQWLSPLAMMILGAFLLILGVVLPLLMVIKVIETSFLLSFVSYGASLAGMVVGFVGLFSYVRIRRK